MGARGNNEKTYACYEEISNLRVDVDAPPVAIYKRLDSELSKDIEDRTYQIIIPIPNNKNGKRKSLRTSDRDRAIKKAEEEVIDLKVQLRMGVKVIATSVRKLVDDFLKQKYSLVRDEWEGKQDAGQRSITKQRYKLIEGKINNYFVPFVGNNSNAKTLSYKEFDSGWESWRKLNPVGRGLKKIQPKQSTIKDEMGMIREVWTWGQKYGYIEPTLLKPFEDINLIPDETNQRPTWEQDEWKRFSRRLREWRKSKQYSGDNKQFWDTLVAYNLVYFLANSGLRVGEAFKLRWQDIKFFERDRKKTDDKIFFNDKLGAIVQVHKSSKTGAREVLTQGGIYLERIQLKSKFRKKSDFVFADLQGKQLNRKWFDTLFDDMRKFTNSFEDTGKHLVPYSLRHFYATTRIYAKIDSAFIAKNMGITQSRLRNSYDQAFTRMMSEELFKRPDTSSLPKLRESGEGAYKFRMPTRKKLSNPIQELDTVFISDEE